jgi:hypothetical protein
MGKKTNADKKWANKPDSAKLIYFLEQIMPTVDLASAIRRTFDEMYEISGQKEYAKLSGSDKCYIGNLCEKNVLKAFGLKKNKEENGPDTTVCGIMLDIKWSSSSDINKMPRTHQIPRRHVGEHVLIVCAHDYTNRYQIGILKADKKMLKPPPRKRNRGGPGQDGKRGINALGYASVVWLAEGSFPKNKNLLSETENKEIGVGQAQISDALGISRISICNHAKKQDPRKKRN